MQFSRYRMKCVSRLRFLLPLRSLLSSAFASAFRSRSAFASRSSARFFLPVRFFPSTLLSLRFRPFASLSLCFRSVPARSASFCFLPFRAFRFRFQPFGLPLRSAFPSGFCFSASFLPPGFRLASGLSLPGSFLRSRFGFPRSLRFASSFPLRFRAALRFPLLRFPALPSAFASGFARSALPFGFRLRSSLRFFLAFARLPRAQLFRFLPFRVFRFPLPSFAFAPVFRVRSAPLPALLLLRFRFASRFAFRFPAVFFILIQFSVLPDP